MRRKSSVGAPLWLLTGLLLAGFGWYWWRYQIPQGRISHNPANGPPLVLTARSSPLLAKPPITTQTSTVTTPATPQHLTNVPHASSGSIPPISLTNAPPISINPTNFPRPVQSVFELQVALAREAISPGSVDGKWGPQTRSALLAFQARAHLPLTGELDDITRKTLLLKTMVTAPYVITTNDLASLQPLSPTWLGKSQQTALEFETILELLAERAKASPAQVRSLNPGIDFEKLEPGASVQLPNIPSPASTSPAAWLTIRLEDRILEVWDENTNLLAHFPCSIGRRVERRPVGELHIATVAHNPDYTFDPENFPESAEAQTLNTKLVLPPGPNNPVGVAWIGLDKPGYGIHGTPNPEQVGRTESHGCFRLANWNAEYLLHVVTIGTPVYVQP